MLNVCKEIFDELLQQEVNYCHWKSNEHLADGLNGEIDMDLLVSKAHAKNLQMFWRNMSASMYSLNLVRDMLM